MRRLHRYLIVFLLGAAALPSTAAAQAQLNGRYTYNPAASDDIARAVSTAVRSLNFAIRPLARGYMNRNERPFQWVAIRYDAPQVSITTDRTRSPLTTPADGTSVAVTGSDGKVQHVSTQWANGRLEQTIRVPDAQRVTTYALSPDGNTLTVSIRLTAPRLPQPLAYRLVYDRAR